MKYYKVFRWFLSALVLASVMFAMQACSGSPFRLKEMQGTSYEEEEKEEDLTPSEDLEFWGLKNEDWQSGDDPYVP